MECEILVSVMNQKNKDKVVERLNVGKNQSCLIINQVINSGLKMPDDVLVGKHRMISFNESGVSRSRNKAVDNAVGDICILSDDDVSYVDNYENMIRNAYKKYPDADMILFHFEYNDETKQKKLLREGKIGYLRSMKFGAPQITFLRERILKNGIRFDENFGPGSGEEPTNNWGEDSIFLFDCIRAGLTIYYLPLKIATIYNSGTTTWSRSNTIKHFERQGAIYCRMSPIFWRILVFQFVLRKRKIYKKDMSGWAVYRAMVRGAKIYRRGE